jgi:hypothetical protein
MGNGVEAIDHILAQGYEDVYERVPDEERRAESRREVDNYKKCLQAQVDAKAKRPVAFYALTIGVQRFSALGFSLL